MTPNQAVSQAIAWLRTILLLLILVSAALVLIRSFGVVIPIRAGLSEIALAYLAGVYWLTTPSPASPE